MKTILAVLGCALISTTSFATDNKLPDCEGNDTLKWHNCFAIAEFDDGSRYEGPYKNGKMHGQAKYLLGNGDVYEGQMVNGAAEGFGIHQMKMGDKYIGQFKNNNYHGKGIYTRANGQARQEGVWNEDKFVREEKVNIAELQQLNSSQPLSENLEALAQSGNPEAQLQLGQKLLKGDGIKRDPVEAAKWFRQAAEKGNAVAAAELAGMYWEGTGVTADQAETLKWARMGAEKGDPRAQRMLGYIYKFGRGVTKNEAEGIKWLRKAAAAGDEYAQMTVKAHDDGIASEARWKRMQKMTFNIALVCTDRMGNGQDFHSAANLMQLAANSTQAFAQVLMSNRECIQPKTINQFKDIQALSSSVVVAETERNVYIVWKNERDKMTLGLVGVPK